MKTHTTYSEQYRPMTIAQLEAKLAKLVKMDKSHASIAPGRRTDLRDEQPTANYSQAIQLFAAMPRQPYFSEFRRFRTTSDIYRNGWQPIHNGFAATKDEVELVME